jgi:hypothetical protein
MRARRWLALGAPAAVVAAAAVAAVAACDDVNVHILSAQQYLPQFACLQPTSGVDVVSGGATGDNCDPTCLTATATSTDPQSGQTYKTYYYYITTTCPPYPSDYTTESQSQATDPSDPCTGAFAAYAGPVDCPPPCTDASTDVCIPGDDGGGNAETGGGDDGGGDVATGEAGGDDGGSTDAATE